VRVDRGQGVAEPGDRRRDVEGPSTSWFVITRSTVADERSADSRSSVIWLLKFWTAQSRPASSRMPSTFGRGTFGNPPPAIAALGFTSTPDQLSAAAAAVQEKTLVARTGGAPTLAVGMSEILSGIFGAGTALKAVWYHFAIMFEALFILTTVDAGTRVARFMLQDTLGNIYKPLGRVSWKPGLWATSAVVVLAWGYFLWTGVNDPLGGIYQLFPLFGIAN
jgi:carbon starvation protein CstA